jgi:hypothetical protein
MLQVSALPLLQAARGYPYSWILQPEDARTEDAGTYLHSDVPQGIKGTGFPGRF